VAEQWYDATTNLLYHDDITWTNIEDALYDIHIDDYDDEDDDEDNGENVRFYDRRHILAWLTMRIAQLVMSVPHTETTVTDVEAWRNNIRLVGFALHGNPSENFLMQTCKSTMFFDGCTT
jgi:hypothetical protein